ncbi:urease accessory protein UreD [Mycobacterium sp. CVI_P3]|uniref:Urease accessory protein UreD n=1 Tax=Mycobacterium pinniadriaticum TaxID=2994102 RepID=A0ABT3S987_9MYCO|nr:urease accessory protein UreD [Mycobacterium pinniadriaticum]MCX2929652.1 urease accessory protein UreD [Mycobacterium pinniadriaticum]MCX2936076.1 urease accessory protein UreD [Mycobacterium pinniadriaticum]
MRSDVVVVAQPGRLPRIECRGALAARHTEPDTVHLVSAAATPLGGDTIAIRLIVEAGARLRLRTAAASVVLPGAATAQSQACWHIEAAGELDLDPEPTIVAADARHCSELRVCLEETSRVRIRERVQIGRTDEREGFWSGALYADVAATPLLRHRVELGQGSVADDVLGAPLACVSELRYPDPAVDAAGITLNLAAGGSLSTWQGARLYS